MTNDAQQPGGEDVAEPQLPIADPPQRVSGMRVPDDWALHGPPSDLGGDAEDAWRQTGFELSEDWRLLESGLALQARLAASGYTPRARTMTMAGFASLWSRAFLSISDAAPLVRRASYQSALPLIRTAVEFIGAQRGLVDEPDEWRRWTHEAFGRDEATRSVEQLLGHYFSGESIAADATLRTIYRAASDFARPNFGPTALLVANEATHERYPLNFADQAFHLGWAQLLLGWLLQLDAAQLHSSLHLAAHFPASEELRTAAVEHVQRVELHLADERRCRVEEHEDVHGRRRHLLVEFRRQRADAPRRLLF